ncbi:MAG TPA: hypothetical protein VJP80_03950 [Candidatus Saccharimonadales bacterium]|nr:hypothetical protein [Candidatus Saccharimonadales bacterium]
MNRTYFSDLPSYHGPDVPQLSDHQALHVRFVEVAQGEGRPPELCVERTYPGPQHNRIIQTQAQARNIVGQATDEFASLGVRTPSVLDTEFLQAADGLWHIRTLVEYVPHQPLSGIDTVPEEYLPAIESAAGSLSQYYEGVIRGESTVFLGDVGAWSQWAVTTHEVTDIATTTGFEAVQLDADPYLHPSDDRGLLQNSLHRFGKWSERIPDPDCAHMIGEVVAYLSEGLQG